MTQAPPRLPAIRQRSGATRPGGRSIIDFLSDGSLPRLLATMSRATGVDLELRDERDRRIVPADDGQPWRLDESPPPVPHDASVLPLEGRGRVIGSVVVHPSDDAVRPAVVEMAKRIAQVASEFCTGELELHHHVREVELMYRLSSLLIRAADPDEVLNVALELVLDAMELDAGSVVLLPEDTPAAISGDEAKLTLKASRHLSEAWLADPQPLSVERLFDRLAIAGEVVVSEDLLADERVYLPERARRENLRGFIGAGLTFRGRPIGVFRLYSREVRHFSDDDRQFLRAVAEHSAIAIEQARLLKIQEEEARTQRQIELAADVQRRMLPRALPSLDRFDIAARYIPHYGVGGDFYDVYLSRGRLSIAIGDIMGSGIAAALLMASVRASLRAFAEERERPEEVVRLVNRATCRDTLSSEFASLWFATIDPESLEMTYCSAGHEPPMVIRGAGPIDLATGGMVVGVDPAAEYESSRFSLCEGDTLIAFTDGLPEARDFGDRLFGRERIVQAARAHALSEGSPSAAGMLEHVLWVLRQFAGLQTKPDDLTLLVLGVRDGRGERAADG